MPPVAMTPEEKRQRRLLAALVTLNVVSIVLLIVGFTYGAMIMMTNLNPAPKPREEHPLPGPMLPIHEQVYNLGEPNRYANVSMQLELNVDELEDKEKLALQEEVRKREAQIRDLIISEFSGKTYRDVSTPVGKEQFKEELRVKLNSLLSRGEFKEVIFTAFAVQ